MEEIEVPSFFICPISLQIMKDPVTVSTGITYDRESIEKWLFSGKKNTSVCPMTKQQISDSELTPNITLRRLIQSWCTINASYGIDRIPTPKPVITKSQISKLIHDARSPQQQIKCLRRLQSIAAENGANKRCIEAAGTVDFLTSIIIDFSSIEESHEIDFEANSTRGVEALSLLYNLQLSEAGFKNLLSNNGDFIECLIGIMKNRSYESRAYTVLLLKSLAEIADPVQLINLKFELFTELIRILRDQISYQATKSVLQNLVNVCSWGRNRVKAVGAGGVPALIDLLLESTEKRESEMVMAALELLCGCAEGRAEFLRHAAGLAVVSKKILRVSQVASEKGVRILLAVAKFSATPVVVQELLQIGVVGKLCLVLQMECSSKIKEKAREVLKLHSRAWRNSPCIPLNLRSAYPV